MAEAAVLDRETTPQLPPDEADLDHEAPLKRGRGRPEGATKEKAEREREHDARSFAELQAQLTEADWEKHIVYVWRMDPWYDNTNGGRDVKYIGVFTSPMSEESLKKEYGSGAYKVQLNKGDKPIAHVRYSILDEKFPPALPPGDWMEHPRNKKWQSWRPLIEARWKARVAAEVGPPASGTPEVEALTKLIQKLVERETGKPPQSSENDKLTSTLVTWALAQTTEQRKVEREGDSPSKIVDMMGAMIKAMKELAPPPPPAAPPPKDEISPTLNLILTGLRDDLKAAREEAKSERENSRKLMEKILDAKSEQTSPLSQLDTFAGIIARVSDITGKVGAPRDWKDGVVDALGDALPKVVEGVNGYFVQKAITERQKAQLPPPKPGAPATTAPGAPALPPATTTPAQPAATATVDAAPAAPATGDQPPQQEMDVSERTQILYIAVLAAQALNLGLKGDQFAEQICVKHGDQAYEDFIAHFPKEGLIEKVKAVPEAWASLAEHEPRLARFLDDFYSFAEGDEEEPPAAEPPPVPAKAAAPAKKPAGKGKKK